MKTPRFRTMIIYRDVRTGLIVTAAYAAKYPQFTVREVRKIPI